MTQEKTAELLGVSTRRLLEEISHRPDFPTRFTITRKSFLWDKAEVQDWINKQRERRPS